MSIKKYCQKYIWLVACGLGLLTVSSCQKDTIATPAIQTNEVQGELESVGIDFTATAEETVIPFNPAETPEELKAFNYNLSENSGKTYPKVKLNITQGSTVSVVGVMHNTTTNKHHVFSADWTYNASNSTLRISKDVSFPSEVLTASPNDWKIFFITGGTYDSNAKKVTFTKQSEAIPVVQGNSINLEAIYMSKASSSSSKGWVSMTYDPNGRRFTIPSKITMSNESVVLLCSAKTELTVDSVVAVHDGKRLTDEQKKIMSYSGYVKGIQLTSNQLASTGEYSNLANLSNGVRPEFTTSEAANTAVRFEVPVARREYVIPSTRPRREDGYYTNYTDGRSKYYLVSVMPRANVSDPLTKVQPVFGGTSDFIGSGPDIYEELLAGNFYNVRSLVLSKEATRLALPIEALLTKKDNIGFYDNNGYGYDDTDYGIRDVSIFSGGQNSITTWGGAIAELIAQTNRYVDGDGRRYELGDYKQWRVLVPGFYNNTTTRLLNFGATDSRGNGMKYSNQNEEIAPWGKAGWYKGDYYNKDATHSYAIRFKASGTTDDTYRSAYRYERVTLNGKEYLKITQRYLGPTRTSVRVETIANENWWANPLASDQKEAVRLIEAQSYWTNGEYSQTVSGRPGRIIASILNKGGKDAYVVPDAKEQKWLKDREDHKIMFFTKDQTL